MDRQTALLIDPFKSPDGFQPSMGEAVYWKQQWEVHRHDISEGSEEIVLEMLFNAARRAEHGVIEIGCFKGKSTAYLAAGVKLMGRVGVQVFAIDPFIDPTDCGGLHNKEISTLKDFEHHLKLCCVNEVVKTIAFKSEDVSDQFKADSIDVLFIDGDHSYEGAKRDYDLYLSSVVIGGVIIFHDSIRGNTNFHGIVRLMDELEKDPRVSRIFTSGGATVWYKVKP